MAPCAARPGHSCPASAYRALDAADEVRALAERLGAPVVSYRRGRGVLDDRHPLAHALPGGHALWAKADVVLLKQIAQPWPEAL